MRLAAGGAMLTGLNTQRMPAPGQNRPALKKHDKQERRKCIGDTQALIRLRRFRLSAATRRM